MAAPGPDPAEVRAVDDPPGEVDHGRDDGPDCELSYEPSHEADRPEQREREADRAEDDLPDPRRVEAEDAARKRCRRSRDHGDLENRPAEALEDVEDGREVRAALSEGGALQGHRRHACVGADRRRDGQHRVPDQPAHDRRE